MVKEDGQKQNKSLLEGADLEQVVVTEVCSEKDVINEPIIERISRSPIPRPPSNIDFSHSSINREPHAIDWNYLSFDDSTFTLRKFYSDIYDTVDHFEDIYFLIRDSFFGRRESVIAHYIPLISVPQYGSRCGFVALSMASQIFTPVGSKKLFDEAKKLGLTLIGEMFDAYEMAKFASNQLHCESTVMCNLPTRKYDLLSHICDGWPVLIPYDQYGSFPGEYNGEKAHWAVLNGLFFSVGLTVDSSRQLRLISTSRGAYVKEKLLYDCRRCTPDSDIFVLAREGTRDQLLAWRLDSLLLSNGNLRKMSAKFGLTRSYDLPNLRDKAVLLRR